MKLFVIVLILSFGLLINLVFWRTVFHAEQAQQFINCIANHENTHMSLGDCSGKFKE
jgi:hypothetical protein